MSQGFVSQLAELSSERSSQVMSWRFILNFSLMVFDAVVYIGVSLFFFLAMFKNVHPYAERFDFPFPMPVYVIVCALIWIISTRVAGVYHRHMLGDGYQLGMALFKGAFMAWLFICAFDFIFKIDIPMRLIVYVIAVSWLVTLIARCVVSAFLNRERKRGLYMYPTVLVGSPEGIGQVLTFLRKRGQFNYRPVAVCPIMVDRKSGEIISDPDYDLMRKEIKKHGGASLPIMRYDEHLAERISRMGGQTVMVTDVLERFSDNLNTFSLRMESLNLEMALITSAVDIAGHVTQMRNLRGVTIMTIQLPQYSLFAGFKKRLFDIVVSSLALIVSSPVMLGVALAIKLEDGGPVFYKQERIGLRGKPFYIHKFRSMRVNADAYLKELLEEQGQEMGARYKLKQDPRITKVGNFIRKTSLDELPQFIDSFLGSMSVVGPRPQRQFEVDEYDSVYATRLLVKPGITGPWQVSGRNDLNEEESRQLDVTYVQDWSVLGDIVYILRTVGIMIHPRGAY